MIRVPSRFLLDGLDAFAARRERAATLLVHSTSADPGASKADPGGRHGGLIGERFGLAASVAFFGQYAKQCELTIKLKAE
jgi:hypothetical protein